MANPAVRARLLRFAETLEAEGFECALAEAGPIPYDTLLVAAGDDDTGRWRLELSFVPDMEEELEGIALLQCFVPALLEVEPAHAEAVRAFVNLLNTRLPLVGFVALETERIVAFRHILMVPDDGAAANLLVAQATWMISYLMSLFGNAVVEVARGASSQAALAGTPFADLFA